MLINLFSSFIIGESFNSYIKFLYIFDILLTNKNIFYKKEAKIIINEKDVIVNN